MKKINFLKISILMLISIFTIGSTYAQPDAPAGKKWTAVPALTDEFNVNALDTSKWQKPLWNYGEPVQMVAENSGVWNGYMYIRATLDNSSARWFKTSRIMSNAQIKFPMYTECRMRTAHISAFSTYWLNNGDINNRDEIDIVELNSNPSFTNQTARPYTMYSQYFVVENGVTERNHGDFDNRNLSNGNPAKGKTWNQEFQVLGCYWIDKNTVQFYINGEEAGRVQTTKDFTRNQNIIWDLWTSVESWTGGIASKTDLANNNINTMYVDWIHTFKLEDDASNPAPNPDTGNNDGTQFYIVNRATGKKIRTANSTSGSKLELVPSTWASNAEKWTKIDNGNGNFYLKNVGSGMYFRPTDDSDGSVVIQRPTSFSGSYTQWSKVNTSDNYFYLKNRQTGKYIRPLNGNDFSEIQQQPTSFSGTWTQWRFINAANNQVFTGEANKGANKVLDSDLKFSQNSSTGNLTITDIEQGTYDVNIYNFQGALIKSLKINTEDSEISINTEDLPLGIYILRVNNETLNKVIKFTKNN